VTSLCVNKLSSNIVQVSLLLDLSQFSWLSALLLYFCLTVCPVHCILVRFLYTK
jgi:hypothetical protein